MCLHTSSVRLHSNPWLPLVCWAGWAGMLKPFLVGAFKFVKALAIWLTVDVKGRMYLIRRGRAARQNKHNKRQSAKKKNEYTSTYIRRVACPTTTPPPFPLQRASKCHKEHVGEPIKRRQQWKEENRQLNKWTAAVSAKQLIRMRTSTKKGAHVSGRLKHSCVRATRTLRTGHRTQDTGRRTFRQAIER